MSSRYQGTNLVIGKDCVSEQQNNLGKRKLALCLEYPIHQQGGTEAIVRELIKGLAPFFRITLVSNDSRAVVETSPDLRGTIEQHLGWAGASTGAAARRLAQDLQDAGVSIAHFHSGGAYGWGSRFIGRSPLPHASRRGIAVFSTIHSVTTLLEGFCGPQKPAIVKALLLPIAWAGKMHVLSHLKFEVAASRHDLRLLSTRYWPLRHKFRQIYHSRFSKHPAARQPAVREQLILNVGHIAERKGQLVLVQAFARIAAEHPAWNLALVGHFADGAYERRIRACIREAALEKRVLLPGAQPDGMAWMRRAAIYVQPSMEEALGLALQEAMYCGCACIGTRVGGIPELLVPGTGALVARGDATAMAAELSRLITDEVERRRSGELAIRSLRERSMTTEDMIAQYLSLYEAT